MEPKPGDRIYETTSETSNTLLYVVNAMQIPFEHMIVNMSDGLVQFKTIDSQEFIEMWKEMSR